MKTRTRAVLITAILGVLALSGMAFGPCAEKRSLENGLAGYRVTITGVGNVSGGTGRIDDPFDFPEDEVTLEFEAVAFDKLGGRMDGVQGEAYNGQVAVKVTPGEMAFPGSKVSFVNGVAQDSVVVRKVFSRVALWLEDIHTVNSDKLTSQRGDIQLTRKEGTWATGVSNIIHFKDPSLRQMQTDNWIEKNDLSSLAGSFVDLDCQKNAPSGPWDDGHGQLVVTGIFNEGFFVTDLADSGLGYNHLYAYSYSYPQDLDLGDRLDRLAGTSQDFSGCTQISFPSWHRAMDDKLNPEPFRVTDLDTRIPPVLIDTIMCADGGGSGLHLCGHSKKNWAMEALESARVRLENIRTPDVYLDCDFNGNQEITFSYPTPDEETYCRDACLEHDGNTEVVVKDFIVSAAARPDVVLEENVVCPWESSIEGIEPNCTRVRVASGHICSELSTLHQFGQWSAALDDGAGPLINLLTRETLVEFDPTTEQHLGRTIEFLQGNLRQVRAARPRWIVLVGNLPGDAPDSIKP